MLVKVDAFTRMGLEYAWRLRPLTSLDIRDLATTCSNGHRVSAALCHPHAHPSSGSHRRVDLLDTVPCRLDFCRKRSIACDVKAGERPWPEPRSLRAYCEVVLVTANAVARMGECYAKAHGYSVDRFVEGGAA